MSELLMPENERDEELKEAAEMALEALRREVRKLTSGELNAAEKDDIATIMNAYSIDNHEDQMKFYGWIEAMIDARNQS